MNEHTPEVTRQRHKWLAKNALDTFMTLNKSIQLFTYLCKPRVLSTMPRIPEISVGIQRKGPFRFLLTGIFGITSEGGLLISVGIFRPKFFIPFLTKRFFAPIREFGKGMKNDKSHSYWLAQFNRGFPLISDWSVWHNGKHPWFSLRL